MTQQRWASALSDLRVLDLTTYLLGASCSRILGDLGADVIRVESPAGHSSRSAPPHFGGDEGAYSHSTNRNKRSMVVDLKNPDGLDVVRRLLGTVDVVVENFGPGVCERLGLDPKEVLKGHPNLVWASVAGSGHEGVASGRGPYDMVSQAASGGEPVRIGIPDGVLDAGLYAVIGILAALYTPHIRYEGRYVDVSMFDAAQFAIPPHRSSYGLIAGAAPPPQGSGADRPAPGPDTDDILELDLGLNATEIGQLRASRAVS